ncbi:glycosyl hydrolase family 8 [Chitiniphilus eburneus]|uniref:cellulase n=1 Tax=Chitiniphilus eburneus TaxID=2571148 RepID=A0A4U0Q5C4_9NEIS|nr:glycosyl hydrolase family 8 [Chitiniphilus eburneus]TJZ76275.1 glycosyl hydrolase family 5 [Chitiniphilus eburneus]
MIRRWCYALLFGLCAQAASAAAPSWDDWLERFVSPEGRVIDTANQRVSHSEGQGYGMLLAEARRDRASFERLWRWTDRNLAVRDDALFAWQWKPAGDGGAVGDRNNATDGDLLIAWALLRGAERWRQPAWRARARAILADVRGKLIRPSPYGPLLLPGMVGFVQDQTVVVNLSYWLFPAFGEFDRADPAPVWRELAQSGQKLLVAARFGRWQLPPDWVAVAPDGKLSLIPRLGTRHGYNAVRIPLYLAWARVDNPALYAPFLAFWRDFDQGSVQPATTDLRDDTTDPYNAPPGVLSLNATVRRLRQDAAAPAPPDAADTDYYPATLALLAALAEREVAR